MWWRVGILIDEVGKVKSNDEYRILSIHYVLSYTSSNLILRTNKVFFFPFCMRLRKVKNYLQDHLVRKC